MIAHICIIQYSADKFDAEEAFKTSPHRSFSAAHRDSVQVSVTWRLNVFTSLHRTTSHSNIVKTFTKQQPNKGICQRMKLLCVKGIHWVSVLIWKILFFEEWVRMLHYYYYVTLVLLQKLLTWFLDLYTDAFPFSYSKVPWFLHHEKRKKKHMQPSVEVESSLTLPPPHPTSLLLIANHIFRRDCKQAPLGAARWVTLFSFSGAHLPLQHCLCTTL